MRGKKWKLFFVVLLVTITVAGSFLWKSFSRYDDLWEISQSKKAQEIYSQQLIAVDPLAHTDLGYIRSAEVDWTSFREDTSGNLHFRIVINGKNKAILYETFSLQNNTILSASYKISKELQTDMRKEQSYQSRFLLIQKQVQQLEEEKWDSASIALYKNRLNQAAKSWKKDLFQQEMDGLLGQVHQVGTALYTDMYTASNQDGKGKLQMLLHQMGAEIDANRFLQLQGTYRFSADLAPHHDFYAYIRQSVLEAYPTKAGLKADDLGLKIHLFRSYLDKQTIDYVRSHFSGETDYDKLLAYGESQQLKFDYTTEAIFHNRSQGVFDYPHHMKVQMPQSNNQKSRGLNNARMIEFIVNLDTGQFISEWNIYRQQADGTYISDPSQYTLDELGDVANTESFNYGLSRGLNNDVPMSLFRSHRYLDVKHPKDNAIRSQVMKLWPFEKRLSQGGRYVDIVKKGGKKDYEAWRSIPQEQKSAVYASYLASPYATSGFASYLASLAS